MEVLLTCKKVDPKHDIFFFDGGKFSLACKNVAHKPHLFLSRMPRDFRPKGQSSSSRKRNDGHEKPKMNVADDDPNVPDDVLREQVAAMGGTDEDLDLIQGKARGPATKLTDAELSSELMAFMAKENMPTQPKPAKVANVPAKPEPSKRSTKTKEPQEAPKPPRKESKQQHPTKPMRQEIPKPSTSNKHVVFDGDDATPKAAKPASLRLLIEPVSDWLHISRPEIHGGKVPAEVSNDLITTLHDLGKQVMHSENDIYDRLASGEGGRNVILGSMNFSDLQFARTLLMSSKASTLSDRISAVTLLLQSSPLHNLKPLELLMSMSGKPSREESSRATRALADWFASGGGLGTDKLHYFRDQPELPQAAAAYKSGVTDQLKTCLCLWAFEDYLKRTYFAFVQLLERQTHDTLVFMRRQAVTQVYVLLRDKSEQEHNLLRLLTNKLGDPDRSVASKASTHLMELLQVHPAMKPIVLREVSEAVLRSQQPSAGQHVKGNQHATYYGVLTLNQTLFVESDAPLANDIFTVYFQLFDVCLQEEEQPDAESEPAKDKKRWRDRHKATPASQNKAASDVYNRLLAGILTGIRRVFPFTTLSTDALDRHLDTLFRITHTHSFNIAIQALQLIFQVAIGTSSNGEAARGFSPHVADRYYRILYDSLLDSRLATTSKQAMYLNLVYKSIKADADPERVKALVKRLCQILNVQEPPFIVGALVLLGELLKAKPGLRAMLTEAEEEGVEHFEDVDDEAPSKPSHTPIVSSYDGRKRDPRFAHAGDTALWDLLTLKNHYHPSVRLNAMQLLQGEKVTSDADLTLNTLMHFLDRFVFKNPKKRSGVKGSSIMQPSLSDAQGDVLVRRTDAPLSYVNTAAFWSQKPENIPADQQFFHQYFQTKLKRSHVPEKPQEQPAEEEASEPATDDEEEDEIWKAMKSSMPSHEEGDDVDQDDEDDDDELLAQLKADAELDGSEPDEVDDDGHESASVSDDEDDNEDDGMFLEDEEDLVPFTNFEDEEEDAPAAGTKRSADEADDDATRSSRSKRRAMPAFASAEDYAHMLDSDDEGN